MKKIYTVDAIRVLNYSYDFEVDIPEEEKYCADQYAYDCAVDDVLDRDARFEEWERFNVYEKITELEIPINAREWEWHQKHLINQEPYDGYDLDDPVKYYTVNLADDLCLDTQIYNAMDESSGPYILPTVMAYPRNSTATFEFMTLDIIADLEDIMEFNAYGISYRVKFSKENRYKC